MTKNHAKPIALIVDDEALLRMALVDMLDDLGVEVAEAGSVAEALRYLDQHGEAVNFLLTDIQMPGTRNGITLANHVSVVWPHIRVLVVSGVVTPFHEELPARVAFAAKPLTVRMLDQFVAQDATAFHQHG